MPTMKYTFAPEIFSHAQRIARTFGLYKRALFSTAVTEVAWDEPSSRWFIRTDRGDEVRARFVAMGTGPLHRPKLPGIPGIETFAGHAFHTSRWDYAYTGGDPKGAPMTRLADKRVGWSRFLLLFSVSKWILTGAGKGVSGWRKTKRTHP